METEQFWCCNNCGHLNQAWRDECSNCPADEDDYNPMWGEESWHAPQDPGHRKTMKWGWDK